MIKFDQVTEQKPDPLYALLEAGIREGRSREDTHAAIKAAGLPEVSDEVLDDVEEEIEYLFAMEARRQSNSRSKEARLLACAVTAVPFPAYAEGGDMMPYEQWARSVEQWAFIDDDGHGIWSDGTFVMGYGDDPLDVRNFNYYGGPEPVHHGPTLHDWGAIPSRHMKGMLWKPAWATHVLWFNK